MANDAADLVDQMILLTRRLKELALEQARLFDNNNFEEAKPINDEAGRLAATYSIESNRIARNSAILADAPAHLKEQLKDETLKFRDAMAQHERTIERGIIIADGLVRAIATEAIASRPTPIAYGANMAISPRRDSSAIALNRLA